MAAKTKSSKSGIPATVVPDPYASSYYMHGHVGSKVTWKCSMPDYPRFQLNFESSNPFNPERGATFGPNGRALVLVLKNPGIFEYTITHFNKADNEKVVGPYQINVGPAPIFNIPPRKCPPAC
jgi:hypothetical protein